MTSSDVPELRAMADSQAGGPQITPRALKADEMRGVLLLDEEFAYIDATNNGRPSVLATALLLQPHDRVANEGATERADYDVIAVLRAEQRRQAGSV